MEEGDTASRGKSLVLEEHSGERTVLERLREGLGNSAGVRQCRVLQRRVRILDFVLRAVGSG